MTTTTVNDQVRHIAYLQRQIADLLNAAGRKVNELEITLAKEQKGLEDAITRRRSPVSADDVADAFAEYHVNTGELNSRLVDAVENRGHRIFPPPYKPIHADWALVENRP